MSTKTRVFLVDDEPLAIERLQRMLAVSEQIEVVGHNTDPTRALREIEALRPDTLFLDIEMPALTGFELVSRLTFEPTIVFTTAYDHYALQAFQVNSIDYLLKPIEPEDLARALGKLTRTGGPRLAQVSAAIAAIMDARTAAAPLQRIASRVGQRIKLVDLQRVSHFAADDKLTYAVTEEGAHVVDMTLSDLEATLDSRRFQRIHRSWLVNLDYVTELNGSFAGTYRVRLRDRQQSELRVARDRVQPLKEKLGLLG
jgi:two-component system, LytTR family, response regulator